VKAPCVEPFASDLTVILSTFWTTVVSVTLNPLTALLTDEPRESTAIAWIL
jgi:hypothetical protein